MSSEFRKWPAGGGEEAGLPDPEVLLRRGLTATTPEFERRWLEMKRGWRREVKSAFECSGWSRWMAGGVLAAVMSLALVAGWLGYWRWTSGVGGVDAAVVAESSIEVSDLDLGEWDSELDAALPLLDKQLVETLDLLLAQADPIL